MPATHGPWPANGLAGPLARGALIGWLATFAFLSVDVLARVIGVREHFDSDLDAAAVIAIELCRALTLVIAVLLVVASLRTARQIRAAGMFALLIAFTAVWYAKAFAFGAYPGHAQAWLAGRLLGAGVPRSALRFIFGSPEWSLWIALGAMLRLSVSWPNRLRPARITRSGRQDRRGMLRSVALAGADIGAAFRRVAASALSKGLLEAKVVWPAVILGGVLHSLATSPWLRIALDAAFGTLVAIGITAVRATWMSTTRRQRERIQWIVTATVIAGTGFLVSGILSLGGDVPGAFLGIAVASLAPFGVLAATAPILLHAPPASGRWLRRSMLFGTSAVTGTIAYLFSLTALPGDTTQEIPVREFVALFTSLVLVVVCIPRLREITDRIAPPTAG